MPPKSCNGEYGCCWQCKLYLGVKEAVNTNNHPSLQRYYSIANVDIGTLTTVAETFLATHMAKQNKPAVCHLKDHSLQVRLR
jgi:hypothetical protein